MYDLFLVDIVHAFTYLSNNGTDISLLHSSIFPELLKQLPISTKLYEQVYVIFVFEVAI